MSKGPLSSKQQQQQKALHRMKVCCVIDDNENFIDPVFNVIETHCNDMNIEYDIRPFLSWRNHDDCNNITRLPAFHIYTDGFYQTTFYANDDVIELIESYFNKMKAKEEKCRATRQAWKKYFELPKRLFPITSSGSITETSLPMESNPMHQ